MTKIIGQITRYKGTEHRSLHGYDVKILAILKNAAHPDVVENVLDYEIIKEDSVLEKAGGVTAFDRVEVTPWLKNESRFSWVTSDPLAHDLACFKDLNRDQYTATVYTTR